MMTRQHHTDPRSQELLFLTDGHPDLSVMTGIFAKEINIYRPIETPTILTTVDASGNQLSWPPTTSTVMIPLIPLIPAWEPIELPEGEIAGFDFWTRFAAETDADTVPIHWTELQRPNLGPSLEPVVESLLRLRDSVVPTNPKRQLLPPHVMRLVIDHAIQTSALCPITMEPILAETAAVTPCGHVFDKTALETWYADHDTCPECRS